MPPTQGTNRQGTNRHTTLPQSAEPRAMPKASYSAQAPALLRLEVRRRESVGSQHASLG